MVVVVVVVVDVVVVVVAAIWAAFCELGGGVEVVVVDDGDVVMVCGAAVVADVSGWVVVDWADCAGCVVVVVVAAVAETTVTCCDAAAAAMVSLPDWLAEIRQFPVVANVTTPALIVQTELEAFAIAMVGARNASLSTVTVYVLLGIGFEGGVDRKVRICTILSTETTRVSETRL